MKTPGQALSDIIRPCANWFMAPDDPKQVEAYRAILKFEAAYQRIRPQCHPRKGYLHTGYLVDLCAARQALLEHNYARACNELLSLLHREYAEQPRIRAGILGLLADEFWQTGPARRLGRKLERFEIPGPKYKQTRKERP